MAQQWVWQHTAREKEGCIPGSCGGWGGTFFSQGHDVVRSSVVKMEYFILWDLWENDKIASFPCSIESSHSK